ncbi:hypothetical protein BDZ91DRAFT_751457 [Kalaharituber pfeilii]|nr:hypothetical protein BDZ91DRAFT_751457 [Kalaharituber pfeilii]
MNSSPFSSSSASSEAPEHPQTPMPAPSVQPDQSTPSSSSSPQAANPASAVSAAQSSLENPHLQPLYLALPAPAYTPSASSPPVANIELQPISRSLTPPEAPRTPPPPFASRPGSPSRMVMSESVLPAAPNGIAVGRRAAMGVRELRRMRSTGVMEVWDNEEENLSKPPPAYEAVGEDSRLDVGQEERRILPLSLPTTLESRYGHSAPRQPARPQPLDVVAGAVVECTNALHAPVFSSCLGQRLCSLLCWV